MNSSSYPEVIPDLRVDRFLRVVRWMSDRLHLNHPPIVDLEKLRSFPPDSLGHAWAQHLDDNGLQPFTTGLRRQQLHDGVHVLTGYGTDPIGEAEVQAFLLGAKFRLVHIVLSLGLLRGIRQQQHSGIIDRDRAAVRSRLIAAYHRGHNSAFDPDTWEPETLWATPLAEVQADFGLSQ